MPTQSQGNEVVTTDAAAHARMEPELKAKWVAALRSGEYKQGDGQLRLDGKFCCLGVLCDIDARVRWEDNEWAFCGDDYDNTHLPRPLREEIGLPRELEAALVDMNDNGKSFSEIADWIEANL